MFWPVVWPSKSDSSLRKQVACALPEHLQSPVQVVFKTQQTSVVLLRVKWPQNWACFVKRLVKHKYVLMTFSLLSSVVYKAPQNQWCIPTPTDILHWYDRYYWCWCLWGQIAQMRNFSFHSWDASLNYYQNLQANTAKLLPLFAKVLKSHTG